MTSPWLLPILIYLGKIAELTLNSIRIVAIAKGFKVLVIIIAFLEAIVWVIVLTRIFADIENIVNLLAFAAGMATGCYIGIIIEEKLALGIVTMRVITQKNADDLLVALRNVGFRVTDVSATSNYGEVKIFFATIKRKDISSFTSLVTKFNKHAFYTVEEIKSASQIIRKPSSTGINRFLKSFAPLVSPTNLDDALPPEVDIPIVSHAEKKAPTYSAEPSAKKKASPARKKPKSKK